MIDDPSFRLPVFYPIENKIFQYQKVLDGWAFSSQRKVAEELVKALEVALYWKRRFEQAEELYGGLKLKELEKVSTTPP